MTPLRILLVDNYDSFTFNLKHLVESQDGVNVTVVRNDDDFLPDVKKGIYDAAIIGPGPGSPEDDAYFGYNKNLILDHGTNGLPLLGVCLGFQGIYHCFGGKLRVGNHPVHGKTSGLKIENDGVMMKGIAPGTPVMRYHSILADTSYPVPNSLKLTAFTEEGGRDEPMVLEHAEFPIYGVQFHPESFATANGARMVRNFLDACRKA
jgi:anthranilate synthase component 2